jgi:hypothetical protein
LKRRVEVWFKALILSNKKVANWDKFIKRVHMRFGSREDVVEEFNKLIQERGMEEYKKVQRT